MTTREVQEIQEILLRYKQGRLSDAEAARVFRWYNSLNKDTLLELSEQERSMLENKLLKQIRERIHTYNNVETIMPLRKWWRSTAFYSGVAAVVIVSLAYTWFLTKTDKNPVSNEGQLFVRATTGSPIMRENDTGKPQRIVLEDSSVITLSPGSRIVYPQRFMGMERNVQLTGDAFFEITKNPAKPFLVYSGKLITRVLGTSFRIKTNTKDKALEVEVVTGKVSVFENDEAFKNTDLTPVAKNNNGVVLTPNQRVTYFPESRHLMTGLVAQPVKLQIEERIQPKLIFNNAQLAEIMNNLENEYGIEIVFANDRLAKCTFTGDVSEMPLYEKLDLLCKSNEASYEIKGTRILVNGEGCD